eukprot:CAMPEP_0179452856 /NCGR_PEP_ID=MMETSP0799-20121207/36673_1 /TAXON_ID=46947 /ORGANISM="Geminigera cryophila, Strain CCMP2564" /LENGTH=329 /DNA_ID=CAMNT_0021249059 /DNA_START=21 /DNA_END=1007 /DNA_ORIENTATION=-
MSAGSKRRADAGVNGESGGGRQASWKKGNTSIEPQLNAEETLQQAVYRLDSVKGYQDDELIRDLEALGRIRDEKIMALAPLYKEAKDKAAEPKGLASSKALNARHSVENQRRAISDEYETARLKVLERIKDDLHKVQFAAQNEIETLAKQGAAAGRVRRKTRARGEAGGFLAEREKANNVASRLQEITTKIILAKDDLENDIEIMRTKTAKEREKEAKDREKEVTKEASRAKAEVEAKAAAEKEKAANKKPPAKGGASKGGGAAARAAKEDSLAAGSKVAAATSRPPPKGGKGDKECKDRAAVRGKKGETPLVGAGAAEEEEKRDESKG